MMLSFLVTLGLIYPAQAPLRFVEDLRIGSAGEGPQSFSQIVALEVDRGGRIYAIDRQSQEIRVFDSTGAFVRAMGRQGQGPGEYVGANGLAWDPQGRLWVVDQQGERYTLLDTAGHVTETHPRALGYYGWRWEGVVDTSGGLFEQAFGRGGSQSTVPLLRFSRDFARRDTFDLPFVALPNFRINVANGYSVVPIPFAPRSYSRLDPRGFVWLSAPDRYRIVQRTLAGDTVRVIQRTVPAIPVTRVEEDSAIEALVSIVARSGPRDGIASQLDRSRIPRTKPALRGFFVDDVGRLWVLPSVPAGQSPNVLDLFSADGVYLGRVPVTFALSPNDPILVRRDRLYTVTRDADDVPYVVRAKLVTEAR